MCEVFDKKLIKVKKGTVEGKYDFIGFYYNKWNSITKPSPRVIIDTHAGTGMVNYQTTDIYGKEFRRKIYGSPLLAMLKTITLSMNLKIILNEINSERFKKLKSSIEFFKENGMPVFKREKEDIKIIDLKTHRKKKIPDKLRKKIKAIFPISPEEAIPFGCTKEYLHTKAEISYYNQNIENVIDEILLNIEEIKFKDRVFKPKALFFVDPCGKVGWNDVIRKIGERTPLEEGTDLIINWSWDAIIRNPHNKNSQLSDIYGIPIEDIDEEFKRCKKMKDYLDKYIHQLQRFFKFVNIPVQVKKSMKLLPKGQAKYVLLYCTNNPSGNSLAGYKKKKDEQKRRRNIADMEQWL